LSRNQPTSEPKSPEIKLETLQALSFELIGKAITLWRTYAEDRRGKGMKIQLATRIHEMVIQAMRFHPDIQTQRKYLEIAEEVERELAAARKVHSLTPRTEDPQQASTP
jgi:hypothetical protein